MLDDDRIASFLDWLGEVGQMYEPVPHRFDFPIDLKDEPYIDLTMESRSGFLVSWDKHVLRLANPQDDFGRRFMASYPEVKVVSPKAFLEIFFQA